MTRSTSKARRALLGLLFVLACLGITLSTIAVWAHQTVLQTDRFVAVVGRVAAEPEFQSRASRRLAAEVIAAGDVQARIAGVLPGNQGLLAAPITNAMEGLLASRLESFIASERAQTLLVRATAAAHARLVTVLRNEGDIVSLEGETVTIDLLPIAVEGLRELQTLGVVPATVTLPDVTDPAGRDAAIGALEARLERDLPEDFARFPVAEAARLAAAQSLVRAFDIAVIVLVLVTIALAVGTVLLARRRLRMVVALALGAVVALVLARIVIRGIAEGVVASLATPDSGTLLRDVLRDLTTDLAAWSWLLVLLGIAVAATASAASRPEWLTSGATALTASTSRSERLDAWLRDHATGIAWAVGILLAVVLLWVAATPELAILVGIGLVVVSTLGLGRRASA